MGNRLKQLQSYRDEEHRVPFAFPCYFPLLHSVFPSTLSLPVPLSPLHLPFHPSLPLPMPQRATLGWCARDLGGLCACLQMSPAQPHTLGQVRKVWLHAPHFSACSDSPTYTTQSEGSAAAEPAQAGPDLPQRAGKAQYSRRTSHCSQHNPPKHTIIYQTPKPPHLSVSPSPQPGINPTAPLSPHSPIPIPH